MDIPIKSHGFEHLNVVIVVDLSQPERLWKDLEESLNGLKQAIAMNERGENLEELTQKIKKMIGTDHPDRHTLDVFPFPVMIVGGKYDQFQNMGRSFAMWKTYKLSYQTNQILFRSRNQETRLSMSSIRRPHDRCITTLLLI